VILAALAVTLLANCDDGGAGGSAPTTASLRTTTTTAAPAVPSTTSTTAPAPATTVAAAATVAPVDPARLSASWRPGCPVAPADLRLLSIPYVGFDGATHVGELVVHHEVADDIVDVFARLYTAGFPIERMELVDVYGGDDDQSTRANNTSAFNCRPITGGGRWSEHAYGAAIDINPVQNPYVYRDGTVLDPNAAPYLDRRRTDPGVIHDGDTVVQAFADIGWGWGGDFNATKDYQHFSRSGR
jgi:hypothetical protein